MTLLPDRSSPLSPNPSPPGRDLALVALAGVLLFLPFLGLRHIWTSGEARVVQVARQMRFSEDARDWIIPRFGDDIRLRKPPLAYWLTALASLPFADVDEFNSRLPNTLAAIGVMGLLYSLGRLLADRRTGLIAALAMGTTAIFWWQARTTGIELPLLFFNTLALYAWWRYRNPASHEDEAGQTAAPATSAERRLPGWLVLTYAALGLSFLEKGPVGPVLIFLILWVYLFASGRWREGWPRLAHHAAGLALFLALVLPWPLLVLREMPEAWDIWFRETAGRFEGFDHIEAPHYFLVKFLGDGQPWSVIALLLPFLLAGRPWPVRNRLLFPLAWAVVTLAFFSIPASKKSYYIMPVYPALALMAGWVLSAAMAANEETTLRRILRGLLLFAGGALALAGVVGALSLLAQVTGVVPVFRLITKNTQISTAYAEHGMHLLAGSVLLLLFGPALFLCARRRTFGRATAAIMIGMAGGFALHTSLLPALNEHKSDRLLCRYLRPQLKPEDRLYTYGISGLPIITYYMSEQSNTRHVERLRRGTAVLEAVETPAKGRSYILTQAWDLGRLHSFFILRVRVSAPDATASEIRSRLAHAEDRLRNRKRLRWLGTGRTPSASPVLGRIRGAGADDSTGAFVSAAWALVLVQPRPGEKGPPDPEESARYLADRLEGLALWHLPLADRLERLDHPIAKNNGLWVRPLPSPLASSLPEDTAVEP